MANTSGRQASIGNGQSLNEDAARCYNALVSKIKAETGYVVLPTEGTRTYARQKYLYDGYRAGRIDPATGRKFNPAWSPNDSRANHLSGRAVDVGSSVGYVNSPQARAWRARMKDYGFRETVIGEPWHFEWHKDWTSSSIDLADVNATPLPESEEDDMTPEQDQRMKNIEAMLGALQNPITDPNRGIFASAYAARQAAERGNELTQSVINWITDDTRGINSRLVRIINDVEPKAGK